MTNSIQIDNHRDVPRLRSFEEAWLVPATYGDGRTALAIEVVGEFGPEPHATLSVNLPNSPDLDGGWFYVKDWSENEGLADGLANLGVIEVENLPKPIRTGFVKVTRKARLIPNG